MDIFPTEIRCYSHENGPFVSWENFRCYSNTFHIFSQLWWMPCVTLVRKGWLILWWSFITIAKKIRCYCNENLPTEANLKKNTNLLRRCLCWFSDELVVTIEIGGKLKKKLTTKLCWFSDEVIITIAKTSN